MHRPRIVLAEAYSPDAVARLRAVGEVVDATDADALRLRALLADADALLVRTQTRVSDEMLAAAPRLRVIGRGGVGLDNVDVAAAHARGITVVYTPAASTRSVAEHTWALILAVERGIVRTDAAIRAGRYPEARASAVYRELGGLTLGVVGMGRIGSAVARMGALGFGLRVVYHDIAPVGPFDFPATALAQEALYAASDIVSLHVPLTPQTRGLIGAEALARFRPSTVLINTARGAIVDAAAVARALHGGALAGAGIDVFDEEPLPSDHPLLAAPNAVLTPHVAGRSGPALKRMNDVVDDVLGVLAGRPPKFAASIEGW